MKNFKLIFLTILILNFILIGILSLYLETEPFRVTEIEGVKDGEVDVKIAKLAITYNFNHPIPADNFKEKIEVTPEADFLVSSFEDELKLEFIKGLEANTVYEIVIKNDFQDIYGQRLDDDHKLSFKTKKLKLSYLDFGDEGVADSIIFTDHQFRNKEIVLQEKNIKTYEANTNWVVAVTSKEGDTVTVKNVRTEEKWNVSLGEVLINKIDLSQNKDKLLILYQDAYIPENVSIPLGTTKLLEYDLFTRSWSEIDLPNVFLDLLDAFYSPDSESIIAKNIESEYFILNLANPLEEFQPLGKFLDIADFSLDGNSFLAIIPFLDKDTEGFAPISVVYANGKEESVSPGDEYIIDPVFSVDPNTVFYSKSKIVNNRRGDFVIYSYDTKTDEEHRVVDIEGLSLELPKISPDNRYLVFEGYTKEDLNTFDGRRSMAYQSKPKEGQILIYDLKNKLIIEDGVRGANTLWVR